MLILIRHAQTRKDRDRPADEWILDPDGLDQLRALAAVRDWDSVRRWYSSPEHKAIATARYLTATPVHVVDDLRELRRGRWSEDYDEVVRRLFEAPEASPAPGWESGHDALGRFDAALRQLASTHVGEDVAVVTHGLVLSLWQARLRGTDRVDLKQWRAMSFPDLFVLSGEGLAAWLAGESTPIELERPELAGSAG